MPESANNLLFLPGEPDAGYRLENFHFHTPNEHELPNHSFDGEIHLVHTRGGHIAVVALFLKIGDKKNAALQPVFDKLPLHLCDSTSIDFDVKALLGNAHGNYYTYTGSLTTPHCDEGVQFFIYPNAITISRAQFAKLMTFGKNARPVQENSNPIEYVRAK
jgi:carbonic anhydrase